MKYSKIPVAQSIVSLCVAKNIKHVVISPGSRNAPLTIGFTHHPEITPYSIVDERCAAFMALGMAQQLQEPVAVVCTSGSALLNYYPAIAEAFYSDIPLVVISADRPIERIDIGDGQTIKQKNVFENHILYSANLHSEVVLETEATDKKLQQKQFESQRHNEREINLALNKALEDKGPVHINVPFYEPLYDMVDDLKVKPLQIYPDIKQRIYSEKELTPYAELWSKAKRKMIIVGVAQPNAVEQRFLEKLAGDNSVLVFTETTSNLQHPEFFTRIDTLIGPIERSGDAEEQFRALQPDILLTFGGMIVSKKIKSFLRNYQPEQHWHVDPKKAYNTFFCLNKHFETSVNSFFQNFLDLTTPVESDYAEKWKGVRKERQQRHELYMEEIPYSDLRAMQSIVPKVPKNYNVQLGNSSTVRYAQLFRWDATHKMFCNRGTSGIDGSVSTAVGAAIISEEPTLLICGDLSFFYDSNGLWNNYLPKNFRIIVLNNEGGGIFRILPGNKNTENFDTYFETVHNLNAASICQMYGLEYQSAKNTSETEKALKDFFDASEKPKLLEIFTPRKLNDEVLLEYFSFMKS
ncbi:2-succinyl-5-enolpyruvyl-6-hydroxy-3-cyclohexene-1-carboxylic-acid synthase [Antarcticibacterium flavum]|uniref:2-succinyl-5-enolpyruvyl-6-hydroxy-3-cyclohexene-1-carboxylate synthase n=1 Tax=Antarcticibacterium flavum TaxID=2058175 RepID=A0A5B7X008_9FLAO|nr:MULTISPECIES: 2-succinyl-5-enolpyruvyl-6-hydroxy-3-cyclohexene-1-carboxylic-acid synthase [Antarcticibacterium]MCM4160259.1 2-succinyl-5-enolpyruvyl-6-hydroxy-3-cyclohexene-1-carboxylic-acid synthase [Antarcticibacterium sp. W02-3]QCY68667.1 2-succinyl-5-enolpyruvyl-6-hydroxy-3-cyclohexene-1-carboxylic-acid synthase [Antarcticibacterium flavum]